MRKWLVSCLLGIAVLALSACAPAVAPVEPEAAPGPEPVQPAAAVGLAGTSWILSSLDGDLPVPGTTVTLDLGADGTASGSDGCNRFTTTYTVSGNSLTFAQPGASTMMACPAEVMGQATAFMDALAATTSYAASARQLILMNGDDILATFVVASQNLADTQWDVTSYNNGREAVVGLLPGTEISANFGADGTVSGNAGCNDYFAGYTVDGDAISIDTPGTTFRFCEEPAGVMEQEAEFLAALTSAATFSIEGNVLQMRTADDALALIMTRKAVVDLPAPAPAAPWGRVIAPSGVNVRSGPGTNFPVVGGARYGDEGEIVGRSADGGWWAVSAPALPGGVGWVSADFVLATNADDVPVIEVAPPVVVVPTAPPPATPTPVPAATATPAAQIAFSADPTTIDQGQCATLTWNVQNVQAVWIYPQGADFTRFPRAGQGSEVVCPPATTTYEMRVLRRDGGTELRQVTVTVRPSAEPQISFWADRTDLNQGECTWLRWDVQNVQGVWVYPQGADFNRYPRVGQDSERVCPDRTTTYEMRVQLRDGSVVLRQVTVNVAPPATATPIANPLAGTRWDVVQFNNGVALGTLLAGTSIRIEFGANGQITGNAGCNGFNGPYRVNGSQISIGPLGASMASCAEPEGIMQQEAEFLAALQTATAFRQDGSMLELQNAGGQIVVIANRAP